MGTDVGGQPGETDRSRGWLGIGLAAVVCVAAVGTVAAFGARWHWRLELATHFPLQTAVATGLAAIGLATVRRWAFAALAVVVFGWNASLLTPGFVPPSPPVAAEGPSLRCISANLNRDNVNLQPFTEYLRREQPAIVVALEVHPGWHPVFEGLRADFPHQHARYRDDGFGLILLSRLPFEDVRTIPMTTAGIPTIVATVVQNGHRVAIIGTHPVPPMGLVASQTRNQQFVELSRLVSSRSEPVVLLGDLNVTPWSPFFHDFIAHSGLRDARTGFGIRPTWPSLPWAARIPIDHALVSPTIAVVDFRVGPHVGSDHRPIAVDLRLP